MIHDILVCIRCLLWRTESRRCYQTPCCHALDRFWYRYARYHKQKHSQKIERRILVQTFQVMWDFPIFICFNDNSQCHETWLWIISIIFKKLNCHWHRNCHWHPKGSAMCWLPFISCSIILSCRTIIYFGRWSSERIELISAHIKAAEERNVYERFCFTNISSQK